MPLAGRLADRRGPVKALRLVLLGFAVVVPLPALAPDLPVLVGALLLLGVGTGALDVAPTRRLRRLGAPGGDGGGSACVAGRTAPSPSGSWPAAPAPVSPASGGATRWPSCSHVDRRWSPASPAACRPERRERTAAGRCPRPGARAPGRSPRHLALTEHCSGAAGAASCEDRAPVGSADWSAAWAPGPRCRGSGRRCSPAHGGRPGWPGTCWADGSGTPACSAAVGR